MKASSVCLHMFSYKLRIRLLFFFPLWCMVYLFGSKDFYCSMLYGINEF